MHFCKIVIPQSSYVVDAVNSSYVIIILDDTYQITLAIQISFLFTKIDAVNLHLQDWKKKTSSTSTVSCSETAMPHIPWPFWRGLSWAKKYTRFNNSPCNWTNAATLSLGKVACASAYYSWVKIKHTTSWRAVTHCACLPQCLITQSTDASPSVECLGTIKNQHGCSSSVSIEGSRRLRWWVWTLFRGLTPCSKTLPNDHWDYGLFARQYNDLKSARVGEVRRNNRPVLQAILLGIHFCLLIVKGFA